MKEDNERMKEDNERIKEDNEGVRAELREIKALLGGDGGDERKASLRSKRKRGHEVLRKNEILFKARAALA